MDRHDTHLLSCSSSINHSYKFDKNGLIISDSINNFGLAFNEVSKNKNNKINIADIFKNLNKNVEVSQEENKILENKKKGIDSQNKNIDKNSNLNKKNFIIKGINDLNNKNNIIKEETDINDEKKNNKMINNNDDIINKNIKYKSNNEEINNKLKSSSKNDINHNNENNNNLKRNLKNIDNNINQSQILKEDKNRNQNDKNNNNVKNLNNLDKIKKTALNYNDKNQNNNIKNNSNSYKITESNERFNYLPFEKEKGIKTLLKENKEENKTEKNNILIKKELEFNYTLKKYSNEILQIINLESFNLENKKKEKYNIDDKNKSKYKDNDINNEENKYGSKYSGRMKFYSKTNSFLYSINNNMKEKPTYEEYIKLPLNNFCLIYKSPIIIKYKNILNNVKNNYYFYSKERTNIENYKNKINNRNKIDNNKNKKIKESIMFDQFNNKLSKIITNKYNLNERNVSKEKNKENYMIDENEDEENNKIHNLDIENDLNIKEKIQRNKNDYNKDNYDELLYKKNNEINKNDANLEENEDNVNLEKIDNNVQNLDKLKGKSNNIKKEGINYDYIEYDALNENDDEKKFYNNFDILNNKNNKFFVSPRKIIQNSNHTILKPINILETKNHKVPNSAYQTPNIKNNALYTINKNSNNSKMREDITGMTTPSTIIKKKIFNDSNITNNKLVKEKKNRNRSLVNILNHKEDYININEGKNNKNCKHLIDDFKCNSKNKYNRHFGNEDSCPICVALQMKNKLLEEKNRMLPLLTKNNLKIIENKSPNKDKVMNTIYQTDKIKRLIRIGSGTSVLTKRNINRRNESVKQMKRIEITNYSSIENKEEMFPVIKQYFN